MVNTRETFLLRMDKELKDLVRAYLKYRSNIDYYSPPMEEETPESLNDAFIWLIHYGLKSTKPEVMRQIEYNKTEDKNNGIKAIVSFFYNNPDAMECKISDMEDCEMARAYIMDMNAPSGQCIPFNFDEIDEEQMKTSVSKEVALKSYFEQMEMQKRFNESLVGLKAYFDEIDESIRLSKAEWEEEKKENARLVEDAIREHDLNWKLVKIDPAGKC